MTPYKYMGDKKGLKFAIEIYNENFEIYYSQEQQCYNYDASILRKGRV